MAVGILPPLVRCQLLCLRGVAVECGGLSCGLSGRLNSCELGGLTGGGQSGG